MRFVQEIQNPHFRISLYAWNGKYIVKIEAGPYEQTYKISEMDVTDPTLVPSLLDSMFLEKVSKRFQDMHTDWAASAERNDIYL